MTKKIRHILNNLREGFFTLPAVRDACVKSKRMVYWAAVIPVLLVLLIIVIVRYDSANHYISRASASKAMALALTDREGCISLQNERGSSFSPEGREAWYSKYIDYLVLNGIFEGDREYDRDFAAAPLTYGEAAYAAEQISPGLSQALNISKKKYKKPMPKEAWWLFYESLTDRTDKDNQVEEVRLLLYGTPDNVKEASAWTAYTDQGILGFEGLSLDAYIDHEIRVLKRGGEIIRMVEDVTDEVTYRNVWLSEGDRGRLNVYIGTIIREFSVKKEMGESSGAIADVALKDGRIKKISLKKDTIQGKVLSVKENSIEIEGYGTFKLDKDFRVYKTYGVVREMKTKDILVGYDMQEFVVAGKKLCAALQVRNFAAQNIRVLLMDTGFKSIYHNEIRLKAEVPLILRYQEKEEVIEAGTELVLQKDDERLKAGRLTVEPSHRQKKIQVLNLKRGQGTPAYFGHLEICQEPEGLLLLNELDLEDYLTKVVPSEMPPSYELEALKAQAVCARTYASRQIQANAYSQYGAHVDDSTSFQVYNNIESSERTDMAVKETDGELVFYGDREAETYYFSTSCGHTTDGTIWGAKLSDVPYLKGVSLTADQPGMDLSDEETFAAFIKGEGTRTYDSGFPFYRWTVKVTNKELEKKITGIGSIQGIFVTRRGTGGIAETVKIVGSDGEKTLKGQSEIRSVLGDPGLKIQKQDGGTVDGWSTLPSAFIAVDETERNKEKGIRTFTIWGGGYGHGVGMSQNGAQEMARQGRSYKEILEFFYDGVTVKENGS